MKRYNKIDIVSSLKKVGLKKGDTIFVNPELYKFGILEKSNNKKYFFKTYLDSIMNIIGKNGTVVVNTYTFQTLRFKKKFDYYKTTSTSGEFGEYVRRQKNSLRSSHPVFSVTALGKKKKYICTNNSLHNYGYNSPYHKLLNLDAKILNLGIEPARNPILHHAQFLMGFPFYYNKLTKVKYYKNKKKINKIFSSSVRYLHVDTSLCRKKTKNFSKKLIKDKVVKSVSLGSSKIYLINAKRFFDT